MLGLIKLKSLVTVALVGTGCYLALIEVTPPEWLLIALATVLGSLFGGKEKSPDQRSMIR